MKDLYSFRCLGNESKRYFQVDALAFGEFKMARGNQVKEGLLTDVGGVGFFFNVLFSLIK